MRRPNVVYFVCSFPHGGCMKIGTKVAVQMLGVWRNGTVVGFDGAQVIVEVKRFHVVAPMSMVAEAA